MDGEVGRSAVFFFHGAEYVIGLSVNGNQLTVEAEEKATCDQWRNTFDAACKLTCTMPCFISLLTVATNVQQRE
jgi:hypothetical protein